MVVLEGSDQEIYVSRLLPIFEGFGFSFGIFGLCKKSRFRKKVSVLVKILVPSFSGAVGMYM